METIVREGDVLLLLGKGQAYLAKAGRAKLNTACGPIELGGLIGRPYGIIIQTPKGHSFAVLRPMLNDLLLRGMKRLPQVILPKDIAMIIALTGIRPDSVVVEAGTGSGYATLFLAHYCCKGEIHSYELRKEFYDNVKQNMEWLGIKNVKLYNRNVLEGISQKGVSLVLLDMKGAEKAIGLGFEALALGGFIVVYSPYIEQVKAVVAEIKKYNFADCQTFENMVRGWEVREHTLPERSGILHTGFITLARKVPQ